MGRSFAVRRAIVLRQRRRRLELDLLHERDWFGVYLRAACDPYAVAPEAALLHAVEGARRLWRTAIMLETLGVEAGAGKG